MKFSVFIFMFNISLSTLQAQPGNIDSLRHEIEMARNDTLLLTQFTILASYYIDKLPDSAYYFADKGLQLSRELGLKLDEALALLQMGYSQMNMGNYARSLQNYLPAIQIAEDSRSEKKILPAKYLVKEARFFKPGITAPKIRIQILAWLNQYMGILYENTGNYEKALSYVQQSKQLAAEVPNVPILMDACYISGRLYLSLNKLDSALIYEERTMEMVRQTGIKNPNTLNLGRVYKAMGKRQLAKENFVSALIFARERKYFRGFVATNLELSAIYLDEGKIDSGFYFASSALGVAEQMHVPDLLLRSYKALAEVYKSEGRNDSTVKYQALIIKMNDSIFNAKQSKLFQNIEFEDRQRRQELEAAQKTYRNRILTYGLMAGLSVFFIVAVILLRNNRQKQRAFALLTRQKKETDIQKSKAESSLSELKTTQTQLIQSEKMASLGQLTAGIAHEIKNPLNFVNNFSELNKELLIEMRQELETGNRGKASLISKEIEENQDKILVHGQRADAIVNSMLMHSAKSAGQKELTDINTMADESLRLAFHGFRAKDKTFNATLKTDLDESIEKINVIPQDFGRVLLNVFNNALYAVAERSKKNEQCYEPTISVSTRKHSDNIEIRVKDNGIGIPENVRDRIFEPFFTTKPTGKGAGLGLSLSYDIVKAHVGEIKVESKEGEGAEFIIQLPIG